MNQFFEQGSEYPQAIIAIDNGNGNTKTEHLCFKSGVESYVTEPVVNKDYFKIGDKYYIVGESHMTYLGDKTTSEECRILTIAAIVKEMEYRHMTEGKVRVAAGLPLGWCNPSNKKEFANYLMSESDIYVFYHKTNYHIEIVGVDVFPQGFAAICGRYEMKGLNMLVDIGNGTINMLLIKDGAPNEHSVITERTGVGSCMKNIMKEVTQIYNDDVSEDMIEPYLKDGCDPNDSPITSIVDRVASAYGEEIIKKIHSNGYKDDLMKLYIIGGGGCILKNFTDLSSKRGVIFIDDICANAKGYAYLTRQKMMRKM